GDRDELWNADCELQAFQHDACGVTRFHVNISEPGYQRGEVSAITGLKGPSAGKCKTPGFGRWHAPANRAAGGQIRDQRRNRRHTRLVARGRIEGAPLRRQISACINVFAQLLVEAAVQVAGWYWRSDRAGCGLIDGCDCSTVGVLPD